MTFDESKTNQKVVMGCVIAVIALSGSAAVFYVIQWFFYCSKRRPDSKKPPACFMVHQLFSLNMMCLFLMLAPMIVFGNAHRDA